MEDNSSSSIPHFQNSQFLAHYDTARSMTAQLQDAQGPTELPLDYTPGPLDICCGRGKRNWNHSGNKAFRDLIQANVDRYVAAPNKTAKTAVVLSLVDQIRSQGALFLKQVDDLPDGRWYDLGDAGAREKVGHSLRDQVTARQKLAKEDTAGEAVGMPLEAMSDTPAATTPPRSEVSPVFSFSAAAVPSSEVHDMGYEAQPPSNRHHCHHTYPVDMTTPPALQRQEGHTGTTPQAHWNRQMSFAYAAGHPARRPSEVWSDFGGEEENRRSTLASTALLESFGRRPSWLAMSFTDSTPSTSLQSAAMQAAAALMAEEAEQEAAAARRQQEQQEQLRDLDQLLELQRLEQQQQQQASPTTPDYHMYNGTTGKRLSSSSMSPLDQEFSGMMASSTDVERQAFDDRRASAISMMSASEPYDPMSSSSFSNIFRSSIRRSSVSWTKEVAQMNWHQFELSNSNLGVGGEEVPGQRQSSDEMLKNLESLLGHKLAPDLVVDMIEG